MPQAPVSRGEQEFMGQRRHLGLAAGWAVVVAVVALWGFASLGGASAEPSVVPGTYTITITGGNGSLGTQPLSLSAACSNGNDDDLDTKVDFPADPDCASAQDSNEGPANTPYVEPTLTVTVDASGNVSAPASGVVWQDIWQRQDAGPLGVKDLLVQFKADDVGGKSVTGHLDPVTGAITLTWRFHIQTTIPGIGSTLLVGSPVSPLTANLTTAGTGGAAYDPDDRTATLVDSTITFPAASCAGNLLVCSQMIPLANTRLGLPTTAGQSSLEVTGSVDPDPIVDEEEPPAEAPDLKITKTHEGDFTVGTAAAYTLAVTNVGTAASSGTVVVGDMPPEGMTAGLATGDGWTCMSTEAGSIGCISSTAIPAGGSASPITVNVMPEAAGTLTNVGIVSGDMDTNPDNNSAADETVVHSAAEPGEADLTIAKSHEGDFTAGAAGVYSLVVSNIGTVPSSGEVVVTDTLPAGLVFGSASGDGWICSAAGQVVTCTSSAPIGAGATAPAVALTVTPAAAGSVTNVAMVAGGGESDMLNDGADDPTEVGEAPPPQADLTIVKSHEGGDFTVGAAGVYSLAVSNVGTAESSGDVVVTDTLPAELSFVSAVGEGWTCAAEGQVVTCTSSAPIDSASAAPVVALTVRPTAAGTVTNTAAVSNEGEANTLNDADDDLTVVDDVAPPESPDVQVLKSHTGAFTQGVQGTYVIRVGNVGDADTSDVVTLVDDLPDGLDYVGVNAATASGWACNQASGTVTCLHEGVIVAGAAYTEIGIVVRPTTHGTITNVASVSTPGDTNAENDTASDPTQVDPPPAPNLSVDVSAPAMTVGTASTITVKVANVGTAATTGPVNLTIPLPVAFGLTSASGTGWSCSNAGADEAVVNVACVTQSSVTAGAALPVVNVAVTPKSAGTFDVGAKVTTSGDASSSDDTKVLQVAVAGSSTDPASGDPASEMPFTGGDLGLLVLAALAALSTGAAFVWASRRRTTAPI